MPAAAFLLAAAVAAATTATASGGGNGLQYLAPFNPDWELSLELGNSVLEVGAVGNETVHHVGVLLGSGVGGSHDLCVVVCVGVCVLCSMYVWVGVDWSAIACVIRLCRFS